MSASHQIFGGVDTEKQRAPVASRNISLLEQRMTTCKNCKEFIQPKGCKIIEEEYSCNCPGIYYNLLNNPVMDLPEECLLMTGVSNGK